MEKINVSIGICAYNEEKNIRKLLESVLAQRLQRVCIDEIAVISDGSTDGTEAVVAGFAPNNRIRLVKLPERRGKYVAINTFLSQATSPFLVLASADTILAPDALENLCLPFLSQEDLGITAGRPVHKNSFDSFLGFVALLQGHLRHRLSLERPKFSELICFKNIVASIPPTFVDEEEIAAIIKAKGYSLRYVPSAVFYNKGPQDLSEFLSQRIRNHIGHILLKQTHGYEAATLRGSYVLRPICSGLDPEYKKRWLWLAMAVLLEVLIRISARAKLIFKSRSFDYRWTIAETTKVLDN